MRVVENNILPLFGFKAMTIFKWIFVHKGVELSEVDINHEAIHWEQEKELLIVGFYLMYVLMFFAKHSTQQDSASDGPFKRESLCPLYML